MEFVDKTIEVEADVRDVYKTWTAYENFPKFMEVIERVDVIPDDTMHWVAIVQDEVMEWTADIVEHIQDQSVSWKARDGRETGKVTFNKIGENKTTVHYQLEFEPDGWSCEPDTTRGWMAKRVEAGLEAFKAQLEKSA